MSLGFFYIVHIREFLTQNLPIYKIGRTENIHKRMKQYPKGSIFVLTIPVNDQLKCELEIKNYCIRKFKQCLEYGSEYFQAELPKLMKKALKIAGKYHEIGDRVNEIDKITIYQEFVNECIRTTNNKKDIVNITEFYDAFKRWHLITQNTESLIQMKELKEKLNNILGSENKSRCRLNGKMSKRGWSGIILYKEFVCSGIAKGDKGDKCL